jgi:hypothetical protein
MIQVLPPPAEQEFPWRNSRNALDVNDDGRVTPLDAVLIINELNALGPRALSPPSAGFMPPPFLDVSGDGFVSALDAVLVINALNSGNSYAEGEPTFPESAPEGDVATMDSRTAEAWMYQVEEERRRQQFEDYQSATDKAFDNGLDWLFYDE